MMFEDAAQCVGTLGWVETITAGGVVINLLFNTWLVHRRALADKRDVKRSENVDALLAITEENRETGRGAPQSSMDH